MAPVPEGFLELMMSAEAKRGFPGTGARESLGGELAVLLPETSRSSYPCDHLSLQETARKLELLRAPQLVSGRPVQPLSAVTLRCLPTHPAWLPATSP